MIIKSVDVYSVPFDSEHRDVFFGTPQQFKQFIDDNFHIDSYSGRKSEDLIVNGSTINITDDTAILVLPFSVEGTGNKNRKIFDTNYMRITTTTDEILYYFVEGIETIDNIISVDDVVRMSVKFTLKFDVFANYLDVLNQRQQKQFIERSHVKQYDGGDPPVIARDLQSADYEISPSHYAYQERIVKGDGGEYLFDILWKVYAFPTNSLQNFVTQDTGYRRYFTWNNDFYTYGSDAMTYFFRPMRLYFKFTTALVNQQIPMYDSTGQRLWYGEPDSDAEQFYPFPDKNSSGNLVFTKYTFMPPFNWRYDEADNSIWINAHCNDPLYGVSENPDYNSFRSNTMFFARNLFNDNGFRGGYDLLFDATQYLDSFTIDTTLPYPGVVNDPLSIIPYNPVLRRYPFSHMQMKVGQGDYVSVIPRYVEGVKFEIRYQPSIDGCRYYWHLYKTREDSENETILYNGSNPMLAQSAFTLPHTVDTYSQYMRNHGESLIANHEVQQAFGSIELLKSFGDTIVNLDASKLYESSKSLLIKEVAYDAFRKDLQNATDTVLNNSGGNADTVFCDRIVFRAAIFDRLNNTKFNKELIKNYMYYGFEYNDYDYPFDRVSYFYKFVKTTDAKIVHIRNIKHRKECENALNRGITLWYISGYYETSSGGVRNYFKKLNKDITNVPIDTVYEGG